MKPEEMEKAIIRNLAEKTGKSLEEWCAVLKSLGDDRKGSTKKGAKAIPWCRAFPSPDHRQTLSAGLSEENLTPMTIASHTLLALPCLHS